MDRGTLLKCKIHRLTRAADGKPNCEILSRGKNDDD